MGRRIFGRDRQLDQVQASLAELEAAVAGMAERESSPAPYAMGLQGSAFHASLRFLRHQPIAALGGVPSDWSLVRRMLRLGYLDQVVCDYYPSYRAATEAG